METDWKKKYEEALERARALREEAIEKEYVNDYVKDYEAIFPELAESEDERIRKELIEFLREAYSRGNAPEKCAKWLVWLDWSKEQKESLTPTESYMKGFSDGVEAQMAEGQKPEWSKEEKHKLNRIYAILGQAADTHAFSTTCRLIGDKEAVELQDFLRSIASLKNRGNSQESNTNSPSWKPSVEQMSVFGRIVNDLKIKMVGVTIKEHHTLDLLYNDLKKLM